MKLISFYTDHYQEMAGIVIPRWKLYCETHHIDCEFFRVPQEGTRIDFCWDKIELCRKQIQINQVNDYLLWVDIDILPIKLDPPPYKFVSSFDKPITMCMDDNGLCTGFMILKKCIWTYQYLDSMMFLRNISSEEECRINSINAGDQSCAKYLMGFSEIRCGITLISDDGCISHPHRGIEPHTFAIHYWANGDIENKKLALDRMKSDAEKYPL